MQSCVVLERLPYGEEGVIAGVLRNVRKAGRQMVRGDLLAEPGDRALVRAKQSGETKEQARFTCALSPNDADDLATSDIEADFTKCGRGDCAPSRSRAVNLAESSDAHGRMHRTEPPAMVSGKTRSISSFSENRCEAGETNASHGCNGPEFP